MNFNSHVDTVVAVAVSLVNTLTPGESHGRAYQPPVADELRAAVAATLRSGRSSAPVVSVEEAAAIATLAAKLRAVFDSVGRDDIDGAARLVNDLLAATGARPQLDQHDGEPWHLHFHGSTDTLSQGWAAGCATGLAVVLGTELYDRLGVCTAARCDRVYVDVSRNGTRRFCSTSCQNRVKAAAFRARQPAAG